MGSLINLSVPTRVYEIQLRLIENHISLYQNVDKNILEDDAEYDDDEETNPPENQKIISTSGYYTMNLLPFKEHPGIKLIKDIKLPAGKIKDIYRGYSNGKLVQVSISHDAMEIIFKENEKRSKNRSERQQNAEMIKNTFQEKILEDMIAKYSLNFAYLKPSVDGKFIELTVTLNSEKADRFINEISSHGFGRKYRSKLSQIPTVLFYDAGDIKIVKVLKLKTKNLNRVRSDEQKITHWQYFVSTIKSRLSAAQLIDELSASAVISFDWLMFMIIAGIIGTVSTFESSSVDRIGCMFVSQLMGACFAQALGFYIADYHLVAKGLIKEIFGLALTLFMGFIGGIFMGMNGPWDHIKEWPTDEMLISTHISGMVSNTFIASLTGVGIGFGLLSGNSGPLNGVAVSAALLLPLLNAGIFAGLTFVMYIYEVRAGRSVGGCHDYLGNDPNMSIKMDYERSYQSKYCKNLIIEFTYNGLASMSLTFINIFIIIITGILVLWVKELAPRKVDWFWKSDLHFSNMHNKPKHGHKIKKQLIEDIKNSENPELLRAELFNDKDQVFEAISLRTLGDHDEKSIFQEIKEEIAGEKVQVVVEVDAAEELSISKKSKKSKKSETKFLDGKNPQENEIPFEISTLPDPNDKFREKLKRKLKRK